MKPYIFIASRFSARTARERKRYAERLRYLCRRVTELGAIPMAPHGYFTTFLDDNDPEERRRGIEMGHEWMRMCSAMLYDASLGESEGMLADFHRWEGTFFMLERGPLRHQECEWEDLGEWVRGQR